MELVVLGCASQAPTRYRNHNGYFLRWTPNGQRPEGILFDPGEGTQRQMLLGGVSSPDITRICVTHFHGDHCLGLPGVLARIANEAPAHSVDVYYPAAGDENLDHLLKGPVADTTITIRKHPVRDDGEVEAGPPLRIVGRALDHRTATVGWRFEEPDTVAFDQAKLTALGIDGPVVGELRRTGAILHRGRRVTLDEVTHVRAGPKVAFIMDTRMCDAARDLARDVDLLVCESTYLDTERDLADRYAHMTATQAAELARDAGARTLALTHYSSRYKDPAEFAAEAATIFPDVVAVNDLDVIAVQRRR